MKQKNNTKTIFIYNCKKCKFSNSKEICNHDIAKYQQGYMDSCPYYEEKIFFKKL